MEVNALLQRHALGAALPKTGSTHHTGGSYTYYIIPPDKWEELWRMSVRCFLLYKPLLLSEHAPPVSRVFLDMDTLNKQGLAGDDLDHVMFYVSSFVHRETNLRGGSLMPNSPNSDQFASIVLKSRVADGLYTFHIVFPWVYMDRQAQARMWAELGSMDIFRRFGVDAETTRRGTLRAHMMDTQKDNAPAGRPMIFHSAFNGEGVKLSGATHTTFFGHFPNEEDFLLTISKLTSVLPPLPLPDVHLPLTPEPDTPLQSRMEVDEGGPTS
jgi:hypothetical protein